MLTTFYGDLWSLELDATCDSATWALLTTSGDVASARAGSCVSYDASRHAIALSGGEGAGGVSPELFDLDVDALAWTRQSRRRPPVPPRRRGLDGTSPGRAVSSPRGPRLGPTGFTPGCEAWARRGAGS